MDFDFLIDSVMGTSTNIMELVPEAKSEPTNTDCVTTPIFKTGHIETPTQEAARQLFEMGLNVFPLVYGAKTPCFKWMQMQTLRIHPTHPKYGLHALFNGQCNIGVMCGHTSGNLFILDLETSESFAYHLEQLRLHKIPIFASQTHRGGHIWLRCIEGEVLSIPTGRIHDGELKGRNVKAKSNGFIVAPRSLHPNTTSYRWYKCEVPVPPSVSIHTIDWLTDTTGLTVTPCLAPKFDEKRRMPTNKGDRFTPKVRSYLDHGHSTPTGQRNTALTAATGGLIYLQISEWEALRHLVPVAVESGLSREEAENTVRKLYKAYGNSSHKTVVKIPATVRYWQRLLAFVNKVQWSGRTGMTDRSVMLAFVERARLGSNNKGTFRASHRELAELARCHTTTIRSAIKRLKAAALINYAGTDKNSGATLWSFGDSFPKELLDIQKQMNASPFDADNGSVSEKQEISEFSPLGLSPIGLSDSVLNSQKTDAAERGALGQTGLRVYQALLSSTSPLKAKDIAAQTGLTVPQVYHVLSTGKSHNSWLIRSGLVARSKNGWIACPATEEQLNERIARPAGTLGKSDKRRKRYVEERSINIGRTILAARIKNDKQNLLVS